MLWGWNDKEHDVIEVDHLLRCAHTLAITVVAVAAAVAAAVSTALFFSPLLPSHFESETVLPGRLGMPQPHKAP